jgi:hypothetical protein
VISVCSHFDQCYVEFSHDLVNCFDNEIMHLCIFIIVILAARVLLHILIYFVHNPHLFGEALNS